MRGWIALVGLLSATPLAARDLPVPADKGWKHAETGLVLTAKLDGMARTKLADATTDEHDISAEFSDGPTVTTIFLFHPAVDDVAMWFERSERAIFDRGLFGEVAPASADPIAFAPPGSSAASALRRAYAPGKGPFKGTALAVMPLGEWLVAIRISSRDLAPSALDARLSRVIGDLRWPAEVAPTAAPRAIAACATPLTFGKAKRAKPEMGNVLFSLLGGVVAAQEKAKGVAPTPVTWCRDPSSEARFGIYRNIASDKGYTMALGDAGRVANVFPTLAAQTGKGDEYSLSLTDVDGNTTSFAGFEHLPAPRQVFAALAGPSTATGQGNNVTIDAKTLGK